MLFAYECIKSISELHENRELINCNASSTVNKKGGGKKLQKQQIILSNFLHVTYQLRRGALIINKL